MVNNIPDIVISFGFLIFYIFWEIKSDKLTDEVKQEVKFMSFYAIEVKFAKENNFTEEQIANYFSKFGKVKEVAPVKDY
jgi:RNA recognition motif-containing protein